MITASLAFPELKACKGLELLEQLSNLAKNIATKLTTECQRRQLAHSPVEIYQGDMLVHDWTEADIIYLSAVCFSDALVAGVADLCDRLKKGTRIVSLKEIPSRPFLELYAAIKVKMTWGVQLVFYYKTV